MKDFRGRFPFRIGTTSYIVHQQEDNLIMNVKYLKDYFDKIQLLFFSKNYLNEVASPSILENLYQLKQESPIRYSVHLPIDLYLLDGEKSGLENSIDLIEKIIEMTCMLDIKEYILHIEDTPAVNPAVSINRELFGNVLERLSARLGSFTSSIFIENTFYDLTRLKDIILKSPHPICMDLGHLYIKKRDINNFITCFNNRIREVHLHGCAGGKDHISLLCSEQTYLDSTLNFLRNYKQSLILEVFNEPDLIESMNYLENYFETSSEAIC